MKTKTTPLCNDAAICLERLKSLNADNQRDVRVNLGVLKAARSEILSHVELNGKGVMTDMVLNALNSAINDGLLLMPQNNTLTPVSFDEPRLHIKEQPAAVTQSPLLHSFYIAYHEWLKSGADAASCIFDRHSGLCANAYDYFSYTGADVSGPLNEMHAAFEAAGLNRELPFNKNKENYDRENHRGECHVNPARVAWAKHHATCPPSPEQYVPQLTTAAADVLSERLRQWSVKGFSTAQDDTYTDCELAAAAISYIEPMEAEHYWPADWHDGSFRPSDYRHNLVKATALLLAEIERIDRAAGIGKEV